MTITAERRRAFFETNHADTIRLYRVMPGAPQPPTDANGVAYWGEVHGNDHWRFCETIAEMIRNVPICPHIPQH